MNQDDDGLSILDSEYEQEYIAKGLPGAWALLVFVLVWIAGCICLVVIA